MLERHETKEHAGEVVAPPVLELPVFFATDRQAITSNKDEAGRTLGPVQLGDGIARVPVESQWQSTDGQLKANLTQLGWHIDNKEPTLKPYLEVRGYVAEKNTPEVLKDIHPDEKFWPTLKAAAANATDHRVYVYIPGFGSSGENSLYASGILASQLEAPVVTFTWPSAGKVGLKYPHIAGANSTRSLFKQDRKMIDDPQVMNDLTVFLSTLHKQMPADTRINLVAHSLGNRLMTKYLHSSASEHFDSVYFLAPDVDKKLFLSALPDITSKSHNVQIFMNPHDRVLAFSGLNNLLEFHSPRKLGKSNISAPGVEFINYSQIAEPHGINHYIRFEQFGSLVRTGHPYSAANQPPQFFLTRRTKIERIHTSESNSKRS